MIKVFGIRHHGPGSAARLQLALEAWQPDALLIELPHDLEPALEQAAHAGLVPPVALLGFDPRLPKRAAYLPFASFSPEWQAIRYALANQIDLRAIDLPLGQLFSLQAEEEAQTRLAFDGDAEARRITLDPLSFLAELAGYADSERWWEVYFEQAPGPVATFDLILETISTLRDQLDRQETRETLAREAFMRQQIRKAAKQGHQRLAVVCGAWHAPVLQAFERYTATHDARTLRGIRKLKTAATWIPWSYGRLSRRGSYRAGVISPVWYELLHAHREEATIRWMSRVSQLLRDEGLDSSPAQATEAVRLAESLAALRRLAVPGLDELRDAALTVLCGGAGERLQLIEARLVIGETVGQVPPDIPAVPLQRDLERCIKTARLTRERKAGRRITKELDLRKPANRAASQLLHRLLLLDIPWGEKRSGSEEQLGSFRETWSLRWQADFAIRLIERGMLGNTVRQAAARALLQKAEEAQSLSDLTAATEQALHADLPEVFDQLLMLTRDRAAMSRDVLHLMESLPALVRIQRYGDTRQTDTEAVGQLIEELLPRIAIGLPGAATGINDDSARQLFELLLDVHHAVHLLEQKELLPPWHRSLEQLALRRRIHPQLAGLASRLLFDLEWFGPEWAEKRLQLALSLGEDPLYSTLWLEGFLYGSGLLLLHHPALWQILDDWVGRIEPEDLPLLLPLLRRAFAQFKPAERRQMMLLAQHGPRALLAPSQPPLAEDRAVRVSAVIDLLLQAGD